MFHGAVEVLALFRPLHRRRTDTLPNLHQDIHQAPSRLFVSYSRLEIFTGQRHIGAYAQPRAQAAQRWGSQGKMGQKWVGRYFAGKAAVLVQRRWRIQLLLRYSVLVQQRHTRGNLVQMRFGAKLREELTAERKAEQLLRVEALEHAWQAEM